MAGQAATHPPGRPAADPHHEHPPRFHLDTGGTCRPDPKFMPRAITWEQPKPDWLPAAGVGDSAAGGTVVPAAPPAGNLGSR